MKRRNKYCYMYVIQGNYGYGWEDLSCYDKAEYTRQQVFKDLKEYRISQDAPCRLVERRELNEKQ